MLRKIRFTQFHHNVKKLLTMDDMEHTFLYEKCN